MAYSFGFVTGKYEAPAHLIKAQIAAAQRAQEESIYRTRVRDSVPRPTSTMRRTDSVTNDATVTRRTARPTSEWRRLPPVNTREPPTSSRPAPPSPVKRVRPTSSVTGPRPLSISMKSPVTKTTPPQTGAVPDNGMVDAKDHQQMLPPLSPGTARTTSPRPSTIYSDAMVKAMDTTNAEVVHARFGFGNPGRAEAFAAVHGAVQEPQGLGLTHLSTPATPRRTNRESSNDTATSRHEECPNGPPIPSSHPNALQPIVVPFVDDPDLRKFFHSIVGVLNNISSPPATPGPLPLPGYFGTHDETFHPPKAPSVTEVDPLSPSRAQQTHQARSTDQNRRNTALSTGLMRRTSNKENKGSKNVALDGTTRKLSGYESDSPLLPANTGVTNASNAGYAPRKHRRKFEHPVVIHVFNCLFFDSRPVGTFHKCAQSFYPWFTCAFAFAL